MIATARAIARASGLRPGRFLLAVLLGVLAVLAGLALLGLSANLICRASRQPPILSLGVAIVVVRVLAIGGPLARYGERLVGHDVAFRALGRLRVTVFEEIEPLAPGEIDTLRDGELVTRLVRDVDEIQDLTLRILMPAAVALVVAPVVVIVFALVLPAAGVVVAVGLGLALVVAPATARRVTRVAQERRGPHRARLTADLLESLEHADELWVCGATDHARDRVLAADAALAEASRTDARGAGWAEGLVTGLAGLTGVVVLALAASAAAGSNGLDPLLVAPLALVAAAVFDVVVPLAAGARVVDGVRAASERVLALGAREPTVCDPDEPAPAPAPHPSITAEGLVVTRGSGAEPVIDGLDLTLLPGERLVVAGPSGAGKSSLLMTIVRFLERRGGRLALADRDVRDYAQADVRGEVRYVEQDPHVFDSTIRANLLFARPDASEADLRAALGRAQLLEFVEELPDGLDTRVGASGRALSGGQRRRLGLARAFLAAGTVLLIDEPTAHLDAATAAALLDDLWAAAADRSVVLVTHGDPGPFAAGRRLELRGPRDDA